jgi:hypothetical protein
MTLEWEPVLKDVISEVLETMFFAMVDFEDVESADQHFDYESEIDLVNHNGRMEIHLRVSEAFAKMITANLLGIEEDQVNDDFLEDSLRELANMVGGGYHARMNSTEWQLRIPKACKIAPEGKESSPTADVLRFGSFGEPAGAASLQYVPESTERE